VEITLTDEATEYLQDIINTLSDEDYHALIRMVDAKGGEITLEDVKTMINLLGSSNTV
jgi:Ca2+-binding EF-hand superfamily protein